MQHSVSLVWISIGCPVVIGHGLFDALPMMMRLYISLWNKNATYGTPDSSSSSGRVVQEMFFYLLDELWVLFGGGHHDVVPLLRGFNSSYPDALSEAIEEYLTSP